MKRINNIKLNRKNEEREGDEVVVTINTVFYPKEYILRTAEKFEDVCWTNLDGDPEGCLFLSLKPKDNADIDLNSLGYEFMNHLLAEIKNEVDW